jgi:hypothetical protein
LRVGTGIDTALGVGHHEPALIVRHRAINGSVEYRAFAVLIVELMPGVLRVIVVCIFDAAVPVVPVRGINSDLPSGEALCSLHEVELGGPSRTRPTRRFAL